MEFNSKDYRSNCPVNFAVETFGDKWTLLVIRDLMFKGKCHYGDFLTSEEKISTNILANRLQRLEEKGVIQKSKDPNNGAKIIYSLTQMGKDLLPVMLEIVAWSGKYDSLTSAPRWFLQEFNEDKAATTQKMQARIVSGAQSKDRAP